MFPYLIFFLLVSNTLCKQAARPLQCKDDNNRPVDWYVLYKLPKLSTSSIPVIRSGLAYLYITNNTVNAGWKLSSKNVTDKTSMPGNTLATLYDDADAAKKLFILYNDDAPDKAVNAKYGHAKGVVMAEEKQGFWLVHSVPNFPPIPRAGSDIRRTRSDGELDSKGNETAGEYSYPSSAQQYGQNFLCISLGSDQLEIAALQLMYNQIIIYRRNIPNALRRLYPVLTRAANRMRIKGPPYNNKAVIKSLGSLEFTSFAKSDKWQNDLYDDFIAPQLHSDMYAQTWLNGRKALPSDCQQIKVYNVKTIILPAGDVNVDFKTSHDHSKWAVAVDNKKNRSWTCVGDINRAETQFYRGGGAVCVNLDPLWKNYHTAVNDIEGCPKSWS